MRNVMNKHEQRFWAEITMAGLGDWPVVDTALLVQAAQRKGLTRRFVAGLYAISLRIQFGQTDWAVVNQAIIARWSISGLKWIKRLAWRALDEAVTA